MTPGEVINHSQDGAKLLEAVELAQKFWPSGGQVIHDGVLTQAEWREYYRDLDELQEIHREAPFYIYGRMVLKAVA